MTKRVLAAAALAATKWIDAEIGKANLDQNGVFSGYRGAAGRYYAFFASGSRVALLFCRSTVQFEAASRVCGAPVNSLIPSWNTSLTGS